MEEEKIKSAVVAIAGLGGLGSNVAVSLARIGIGKLVLVDFDRVEKSNLNRQYYFLNQIGKYKTDSIKEVIENINEEVKVEIKNIKITKFNIEKLFKDVDILVEALDKSKEKAMLVNNFLIKFPNKKLVAASGISGYRSSNLIKTKRVFKNVYLSGDNIEETSIKENLFLAPRVSIVANHQANQVLRLILGQEDV